MARVRTIAAAPFLILAFAFAAAPASAATQTFTQSDDVTILHSTGGCTPASPYPSQNVVSGMGGTIADVNVILDDFEAPLGNVVVMAPTGEAVMLTEGVQVGFDGEGGPFDVTFDDAASSFILLELSSSGTFKPASHGTSCAMPGVSCCPTFSLASLNGDSPNGTWKLYVVNHVNELTGSLGAWSVQITTVPGTSITFGPPILTTSRITTFSFTGDGATAFQCSLDYLPFSACTSPKSYRSLALGPHVFRVRAVDGGGVVDPTPAQRVWFVAGS